MQATGKIMVLMPELHDPLDFEFLQGVQEEAALRGYDTIVATGIVNALPSFQDDGSIQALQNIYTLILQANVDGILFATERFFGEHIVSWIYELLRQIKTPCLVAGEEPAEFPHFLARQQEGMYSITKHLIDAHHCRRIYCLAGVPGHASSEQRLEGYRQAMADAGLHCGDDTIFYGYYWKPVPEELGEKIAAGEIPMPDAVACANDVMAITLMETLAKHGIRVPEDIAVTGYDDSWDALFHSLTTVSGRDRQFGADSFLRLYSVMTGEETGFSPLQQELCFGKSCGCGHHGSLDEYAIEKYIRRGVAHSAHQRTFLPMSFIDEVSASSTIFEWVRNIDCVAHVIGTWEKMDICLCENWQFDLENPTQYRQVGYSDQMYLALSKRIGWNAPGGYYFPTKELLPSLAEPHEPMLMVLTSLHLRDQIFGYIAMAYKSLYDIDLGSSFVQWCNIAANGLNRLQNLQFRAHLNEQLTRFSNRDPQTGLPNQRSFSEQMPAFWEKCRQRRTEPKLLLLCPLAEQKAEGYDIRMLFVHALQAACAPMGEPFILAENVFGILLPENGHSEQEMLGLIQGEMQTMLGDVRGIEPPELLSDTLHWEDRTTPELQSEIAQRIDNLAQSALRSASRYYSTMHDLQQLRKEILTAPQENWTIDEIAKKMNMSRSHLQRLYRKLFGTTCLEDVIAARIEKACQLLTCTDLRINEIAYACGYQNEAHFMRQFKDKLGVTALQYRKQRMRQ